MSILAHNAKTMNYYTDRILLCGMGLLNTGVWFSGLETWYKVALAIASGLITIMSMMNTYKTFVKNYRTLWVVIYVERVITYMRPKKRRHHKSNISNPKNKPE